MPAEIMNPISIKLNQLRDSGISREKICAAAEIKFNTLRQSFNRNRVSERIYLKLLLANIITEEDINEYKKWVKAVPKGKHSKRKNRAI